MTYIGVQAGEMKCLLGRVRRRSRPWPTADEEWRHKTERSPWKCFRPDVRRCMGQPGHRLKGQFSWPVLLLLKWFPKLGKGRGMRNWGRVPCEPFLSSRSIQAASLSSDDILCYRPSFSYLLPLRVTSFLRHFFWWPGSTLSSQFVDNNSIHTTKRQS